MRKDTACLAGFFLLLSLVAGVTTCRGEDDSLALYFERLRERSLFSIAESYAVSRLGQSHLSASRRVDLTIELSRTLARHAEFATETQQQDLWKRAVTVIDDERQQPAAAPFALLLDAQAAMVPAGVVDWLRLECELHPFDETLAERARKQGAMAIQALTSVESALLDSPRGAAGKAGQGPSSHDLRNTLHHVRFALARALRNQAELLPADSHERTIDLIESESTARKLIGVADEPTPFRAKLLLVECLRLKGELNRAEELLAALEKSFPSVDDNLIQEVAAERVRVLLDRQQAPTALQLIVDLRTSQQRLSGDLWYLQVRCLFTMRDAAIKKKNQKLADQLRDQASVTLERCDDQIGGYWSRRCHELWEATRTAEKYGPKLDQLMQQARADFLAGRSEDAVKGYLRGETAAKAAGATDLAFDLGYTQASILLQEKQYDSAAAEFLRLVADYPQNRRAAAAHLNGAYCLGRLYDELKTRSRRERYTEELDRHLELFTGDDSAGDARFMKAQLEEQRFQATVALPLYLEVPASHARGAEAQAGAARCYESILLRMRERHMATLEFEQTARTRLLEFLRSESPSGEDWTAPQSEVAVHLASILVLTEPPRFDQAEQLLKRIIQSAKTGEATGDQAARWEFLRQRAESLRVITLAGNGKPLEAERKINALASASPRDLLVIVERLAPFVSSRNRQRQIQYVNLQLHAAAQLEKHRSALTKDEQNLLDQAQARALLANGEIAKAVAAYERQAAAAPQDIERQRQIASLMEESGHRECSSLARQCWRRVESQTAQGSPDWLNARLGIVTTTIQLKEYPEAKKLLAVTRLLYPELGGDELKSRFDAVAAQLESHTN